MREPKRITWMAVALAGVAAFALAPVHAGGEKKARTLSVTGTFGDTFVISRTETPVAGSACTFTVTREAEIGAEGEVAGRRADFEATGVRHVHGMINRCIAPNETFTKTTWELDVTIGHMSGALELAGATYASGNIQAPPAGDGRVAVEAYLEIVGGSGDFEGSSGYFFYEGISTTTSSSNTFRAQIVVPKGHHHDDDD